MPSSRFTSSQRCGEPAAVPSQQSWILREKCLKQILRIVRLLVHRHELLTVQQKDPTTHGQIVRSGLPIRPYLLQFPLRYHELAR